MVTQTSLEEGEKKARGAREDKEKIKGAMQEKKVGKVKEQ